MMDDGMGLIEHWSIRIACSHPHAQIKVVKVDRVKPADFLE